MNSGVPLKRRRSFWVLRGDPDRAGVEMADAHHDAAGDYERRCGEAELLRPEQRSDHDVATRLDLAVDLDDDPVSQAVAQQRLLGLGEADLPRDPGVLKRGERGGAGPAVVPGDEDDVSVRLRHARRDSADADLGHELHVDAGSGIGVLQVVDELRDVLDRVDVVVRRRGDQADSRGGMPGLRNPRVDLLARELASFAGLCSLGDLDLEVVGVYEVLARHPEASGRHLFHRRAARVAVLVRHEAIGVLSTLAGVRLTAQAVHGDGERLVCLGRDGAVAHGTSREAPHYLGNRLHLLERHRGPLTLAALREAEQPTDRGELLGLVVDERCVLLEDVVALGPRRVLKLEDRLRVEKVVLAVAAPLVLTAGLDLELARQRRCGSEGRLVAAGHLGGDLVWPDAPEATRRTGEVTLDEAAV